MSLSSEHDEFRAGKMGPLYLGLLEAAVSAGVQWSPSTSFQRTTDHDDGVRIELDTHGRRKTILSRYIIGADGANSRVARELGLSQNREWIVGVEEVYDSVALNDPPCLHCFLDPELAPGYIAWLAHDGEELNIGVGGYGNQFDPNARLQQFREEARQYFSLSGLKLTERRGGRIPIGGILPEIVNSSGLLLGDAAGAVSPLTAGGLDPCLRQSALAVQVITEFLNGGDVTTLDRYRSIPFRKRFRFRNLLRRGLSSIRRRGMAEFAFLALRTFPFNRIAQHVFFGRSSFPLKECELPSAVAYRNVG